MTSKTKSNVDKHNRRRQASREYQTRFRLEYQDAFLEFKNQIIAGPVKPKRRKQSTASFRKFCENYGGAAFTLGWSKYHLQAIAKIESCVLDGGFFAFAMPRGSGKTTLCHWAVLWAILCGHCDYVQFVGATSLASRRRLANLKRTLRFNDLLLEDFPEVIGPIRHLEGEARGSTGQKFAGVPTCIEWKQEQIVTAQFDLNDIPPAINKHSFPKRTLDAMRKRYAPYTLGTGAIIECISIEGELRGRNYEKQNGEIVRPKLILPDDPQTRDSAKSLAQIQERENKIVADLAYGKGPGQKLGVLVPCTVIYEGDLADRLLNKDLNPEFRGEKSKMVDQFPEDFTDPDKCPVRKLWDKYREAYVSDLETGSDTANKYYKRNRKKMDEGFLVAWPERYDADKELSAIQHAMNLFYRDEAAFWAEAQNDPAAVADTSIKQLVANDVIAKSVKIDRYIVPNDADYLVAFIDISEKVFWWAVVAVTKKTFAAHVVDFGTSPDQRQTYYTLGTLRKTLQKRYRGEVFADILVTELDTTLEILAGKPWQREDGSDVYVNAVGIDSGWGDYTNDVYQYVRRSTYKNILHACKGVGVTARTKPLVDAERKRAKNTRENVLGQWKQSRTRIGTVLTQYNTNFWKAKAYQLWLKLHGGLTVFNARDKTLQVFADQVAAEKFERDKNKNGREVDVFSCPPGTDNHFGDCVIGCLALSHILGASLPQAKRRDKIEANPRTERAAEVRDAKRKKQTKRKRYNIRF